MDSNVANFCESEIQFLRWKVFFAVGSNLAANGTKSRQNKRHLGIIPPSLLQRNEVKKNLSRL